MSARALLSRALHMPLLLSFIMNKDDIRLLGLRTPVQYSWAPGFRTLDEIIRSKG